MKCPYCNEEIQSDAKKCRFCGEWLEKTENKKITIKEYQKIRFKNFLLGLKKGIIIILIFSFSSLLLISFFSISYFSIYDLIIFIILQFIICIIIIFYGIYLGIKKKSIYYILGFSLPTVILAILMLFLIGIGFLDINFSNIIYK